MLFRVITLSIVFAAIILSRFIVDRGLQALYWLIVFLLTVTVGNIYMTIHYYIKLRNAPELKVNEETQDQRDKKEVMVFH